MFKKFLALMLFFSVLGFSMPTVLADISHSNTSHKTTYHEKSYENEKPAVIESWYKVVSFDWGKFSRDDAWNILGTIVIVGGAYVVITNLSNSISQSTYHHGISQQSTNTTHGYSSTPVYHTTLVVLGFNQAEYNRLLADVKILVNFHKKSKQTIESTMREVRKDTENRFGIKLYDPIPVVDNSLDIQLFIANYLMKIGTPAAAALLNDLDTINYLL